MNHDIAHCKGIQCQLYNSCLRYAAHRDLLSQRNHRLREVERILMSGQARIIRTKI